jgi:hypothetical protein
VTSFIITWKNGKTEKRKNRKTEKQKNGKTEKRKNGKTEKRKNRKPEKTENRKSKLFIKNIRRSPQTFKTLFYAL